MPCVSTQQSLLAGTHRLTGDVLLVVVRQKVRQICLHLRGRRDVHRLALCHSNLRELAAEAIAALALFDTLVEAVPPRWGIGADVALGRDGVPRRPCELHEANDDCVGQVVGPVVGGVGCDDLLPNAD
jgi:hypothetical protein